MGECSEQTGIGTTQVISESAQNHLQPKMLVDEKSDGPFVP